MNDFKKLNISANSYIPDQKQQGKFYEVNSGNKEQQNMINPQMLYLTPQITGTRNSQNIPIQKYTASPNLQSMRSINPINNLIYNIHDSLKQK
jgi:hypothetical protein